MSDGAGEAARLAEMVRTSPHLDAFTRAAWLELLPNLDAATRARLMTLLEAPPVAAPPKLRTAPLAHRKTRRLLLHLSRR